MHDAHPGMLQGQLSLCSPMFSGDTPFSQPHPAGSIESRNALKVMQGSLCCCAARSLRPRPGEEDLSGHPFPFSTQLNVGVNVLPRLRSRMHPTV